MTYGLLIIHGCEGKELQSTPTQSPQVAILNRFRYSFAMTYGLLMISGFEGHQAPRYSCSKGKVDGFRYSFEVWTTDYLQA